ncbi:MAG: helix-turn-helix domain-containing protein [Gracilibacteraceae bacterium]|jgi:DNA-binding Xre family transcriptional regulator|nr:helix-turn-helix domain-containing protein [Gracilibacteraceae bacterium]
MDKRISYNRLWKLLIDRGLNKTQLKRMSGVSTTSIAKMGKGENLNTDVLLKICIALGCSTDDIMEVIDNN